MELPGLPLWSFKRAGWKVIFYQYPWETIYRAKHYVQTLEAVYADAKARLQNIPSGKRVIVAGISLGSLPATRLAASFKRVEGLILNVPYADPVTNLYDFGPTRRRVNSDGYVGRFLNTTHTRESLDKELSSFSPLKRAKDLGHVKVVLFVAHRDKYFLYRHTKKLRDALDQRAKQFICFESKSLGHWMGASKYNLQSASWLKWLG